MGSISIHNILLTPEGLKKCNQFWKRSHYDQIGKSKFLHCH
uniref:Uncharacterized protein n=1 Tax=Anguilla anguilla TaxID=7936 RepID=A0A0E9PWD2_ANGAN